MSVTLLFLAVACDVGHGDGLPVDDDTLTGSPPTGQPAGVVAVAADVPPAFDPLHGPLLLEIETEDGAEITVTVSRDGDDLATLAGVAAGGSLMLAWAGRDGDGEWVPAGPCAVQVDASLGARQGAVVGASAIVRAAFTEARLVDDDGVSALRVPLYWAANQELQDEAAPVATLAAVDEGGIPLDFPAVDLTSLTRRPLAEPVAYRYDSEPLVELVPALTSEALGPTGIDLVAVDVAAVGWTVLSGSPLSPGTNVVLQRAAPLGDTVGVTTEELVLAFSVGGEPVGEQHLPLHVYRVLDVSQFDRPEPRYAPWAAVIDEAMTAIDGTPATQDLVLDALVDFVYLDLGLTYDTVAGASFYSTYAAGFFDGPHFYLSDFLARKDGNVVNCSDAGNILGAYANMAGARLDHLIIEPGFDLNYILAIGNTEFTSCPFGPFSCGFSYHAVTTYPGALRIWDATLALDGDDDPSSLPNTQLAVQNVDALEYLDRLVRAGFTEYGHQAQETLE